MRKFLIVPLLAAVVAAVACDTSDSPDIASVSIGNGNVSGFAISPTRVRLLVGDNVQLSTNMPREQFNLNVAWASTDPAIAFVSPTGLVTGGQIGTATIYATLLTDTTQVATSTVQVLPR
jgi:uncharacterized protein YjdB